MMTERWYTLDGLKIGMTRYVFAGQFVKDRTILEIGCENGYGTSYLMSKGAGKVIGGDISEEAIEYAKAHYEREGLQFVVLDAQKLEYADSYFDTVVAFELIEHLERYEDFLCECKRVLKDGGVFICSTPNREINSPNADKPWFPGHVKEFSVEEFRSAVADYFPDVLVYGIGSGSGTPGIITRMVFSRKPRMFRYIRPLAVRMVNILTRFVFKRYRFVSLDDINEQNLDKMADRRLQPFLLQDNALPPLNLVLVARKK